MATGRIEFFNRSNGRPSAFNGVIIDDEIGFARRCSDVHFDERALSPGTDPAEVKSGTRVQFKYASEMDEQNNIRAASVTILEAGNRFTTEDGELGSVKFHARAKNGLDTYGYIVPDTGGPDLWFDGSFIIGGPAEISGGTRVKFKRALDTTKPSVVWLKEIR